MEKLKKVGLAICLTFILLACPAVFPYKYYGLAANSWEGWLRGPTPKDDLPLSQCSPNDTNPGGRCIVMKSDKFYKSLADYEDMQNRLEKCEQKVQKYKKMILRTQ